MAYIEHNFFPLKVFVRNEYLYQNTKGHGEFTEGVIMSVRCMPNQAALFQVLFNNGVMRDKLPSHALLTKPFPEKPDYLVNKDWYNCEGYEKWSTEDSEYMFYDNK